MPDKKLTDSEIIKALRSWLEEIRKSRQAYLEKVNEEHYPSMRYEYLLSDTIHEINRLQAENENYSKNNQQMTSDILKLYKGLEQAKAELEEYQKIKTTIDEFWEILLTLSLCKRKEKPTLEEFAEAIQEIKAEAVTKFAERLKAEYTDFDEENEVILPENLNKAINDLLKETAGALKGDSLSQLR